jgi:hypothetical protein
VREFLSYCGRRHFSGLVLTASWIDVLGSNRRWNLITRSCRTSTNGLVAFVSEPFRCVGETPAPHRHAVTRRTLFARLVDGVGLVVGSGRHADRWVLSRVVRICGRVARTRRCRLA